MEFNRQNVKRLKLSVNLPRRVIPRDIPEVKNLNLPGVVIGGGSFATCELANIPPDTTKIVMKKMTLYEQIRQKDKEAEEMMFNKIIKEARLLQNLKHKNIVQFIALKKEPLSVLTELMQFDLGKLYSDQDIEIPVCYDLQQLLSMVSSHEIVEDFTLGSYSIFDTVADDIAQGLSYVHQNEICHRDLKPSNILVANCQKRKIICKLSDFGEGKAVDIQTKIGATQILSLPGGKGTLLFNPPEQYEENVMTLTQLQNMDVWSYAMILFCLLNPNKKGPWLSELNEQGGNFSKALERLMTDKKTKLPLLQSQKWHSSALVYKVYCICAKIQPEERPLKSVVIKEFERTRINDNSKAAIVDVEADDENSKRMKMPVDVTSPDHPVPCAVNARTLSFLGNEFEEMDNYKTTANSMASENVGKPHSTPTSTQPSYESDHSEAKRKEVNALITQTSSLGKSSEAANGNSKETIYSPSLENQAKTKHSQKKSSIEKSRNVFELFGIRKTKKTQKTGDRGKQFEDIIKWALEDIKMNDPDRAFEEEQRMRNFLKGSSKDETFKNMMTGLEQELQKHGLKLVTTPADGNCLFHAVSGQIEQFQADHVDLRSALLDFMTKLSEDEKKDLEPSLATLGLKYDEYISNMGTVGYWGDSLAISMMSRMLDANIEIISTDGKFSYGPKNAKLKIYIGYIKDFHFVQAEKMSIKTAERETVLDKVTLHSNKHQSKNTASSPPRPEDMSSSANSQCSVIDEFSPLVLSGTMDTFSSIEDEAITVESSSSRQDMCNTVSSSFRQDTASSPLRRDTIDVTDSSSSSEVLSEILQSHSSSQSNLQRDSTTRNYTAYKEGLTKGLTMKTLADICIQGNCNKTVVCQAVPTDITTNSVFIVDLEKVDYKDLKVDNLGIYEKHSKPTNFVTITVEDDRVVECKLANKADIKDRNDVIKIMRYYSYHAGLYGFKRIITTFSQSDYYAQYAVVQYIVGTNDPSKILVKRAHGNSKDKSVSFYRSSPSVQEKIIEEGKQQKSPKDIISSFQSSNSEKSFCISKEIRNRDQVYNLLKKVPMRKRSRNTGPKKDPELQKLIMLQKEGKYLKDVSFKSSSGCPNTFATTDNSLHWVKKFCVPTTKGGNCVLGIDMTFNVGPYYVTLCQVQLPLFVIKKQPYRHPSVIVGMMTSQSKTTNDYKYLANNFKEHGVKKLISGSDGEAALEKALDEVFPSSNTNANKQSIHLRDFDHLCGDMRGKLDEIGVSSEVKNTIVTGILGEENDGCRVNGLVDCETEEEFEIRYEDLKNNYPADFVSWLETRKGRFRSVTETLKKCMLKPVRVLAGLGNPPNKFSTNANEAQNNVLKDVVGRINTDQTELHEMVYEKIIKPQENELQRAIYKIGEYRLAPGFKKFEVEPTDWAKMSQQQKEKHVLNVFHQLPQSDETLSDDFKPLSVSLEDLQIKDVPLSTLYSVWRRAEVILHNHAVIDLQDSYYCVTEKHTSNTVNTTKGFSCSCKRYSLTGGLCEHCVVVAEKQQNLNHYLALFSAKSNKAFKGVASASKTRGNKPNQTQRRRGCNNSKTKPVVHEQQDSVPKVSFTEIYHNNNPFHIVLVKDEKKCIRCKSCLIDFNKNNPEVPFDLCLKHEERWLYPKLIDGKTQMVPSVSKTTNNFYCLKPPCVKKRHPYFYKGLLSISDDVARKMKSDGAYIEYMLNHFSYYVE